MLTKEQIEWCTNHVESALYIFGSTVVFIYLDKYNKRRSIFLCIINGLVGMTIICLTFFICTKAGFGWWKFLASAFSPFYVRPFISRLLRKAGPMWDNIFELVDKKITKSLK